MTPTVMEKLAYTVECFLNATRTPDGGERTAREAQLVKFLQGDGKRYAVYQGGNVFCHERPGKAADSFTLGKPVEGKSIWCDGRKISAVDTEAFRLNGKLVMLGAAGLILTMPGTAVHACRAPAGEGDEQQQQ